MIPCIDGLPNWIHPNLMILFLLNWISKSNPAWGFFSNPKQLEGKSFLTPTIFLWFFWGIEDPEIGRHRLICDRAGTTWRGQNFAVTGWPLLFRIGEYTTCFVDVYWRFLNNIWLNRILLEMILLNHVRLKNMSWESLSTTQCEGMQTDLSTTHLAIEHSCQMDS